MGNVRTPIRRDYTALPVLENELCDLLVAYQILIEAQPCHPNVMVRAETGRKAEAILTRIGVIEEAIAATPARTLADAAVQLRRIEAALEEPAPEIARMLVSVLAAIERAAAGGAAMVAA